MKSVERLHVSTPVVLYRYHYELLGKPLRWIHVYIVALLEVVGSNGQGRSLLDFSLASSFWVVG